MTKGTKKSLLYDVAQPPQLHLIVKAAPKGTALLQCIGCELKKR